MAMQFQSTLPVRGATGKSTIRKVERNEFQSTLPVRGATTAPAVLRTSQTFQSTLPVRGATSWSHSGSIQAVNFNPRSP